MKDGSIGGWSNMNLKNLLPEEAGIFICDYKKRDAILKNRRQAADSLKNKNGGPLGILYLKEIVIGSSNEPFHSLALAKLPGIKKTSNDLFSFNEGPSLRLKNSKINGIEKIVVKVKSIKKARTFLVENNLLGAATTTSIYIDPKVLDGLIIELTDN